MTSWKIAHGPPLPHLLKITISLDQCHASRLKRNFSHFSTTTTPISDSFSRSRLGRACQFRIETSYNLPKFRPGSTSGRGQFFDRLPTSAALPLSLRGERALSARIRALVHPSTPPFLTYLPLPAIRLAAEADLSLVRLILDCERVRQVVLAR